MIPLTKEYWPQAVRIFEDGHEDILFTYQGFSTQEDAMKQFDVWRKDYGFQIKNPTIDFFEAGKRLERIFVKI